MKMRDRQYKDPEIKDLFRAVNGAFANISSDNFRSVVLTGTTNASADTKSMFKHDLGKVPAFWFPLEGRVYVPLNGFSETEMDLRSTVVSEPFKILVVA